VAARSSTAARQSTARFAGFLADVVRSGANAAVRRLGLSDFVGRSIDQLFAALADAIAPDGSTNEKATSRRAVMETMTELYEKWGVEDGGLERLDSMSADDARDAIIEAVGASIFSRWALELGSVIESKAVSTKEAVMIEGEMREYIHGTLKLDLKGVDVTAVDWAGPEGAQIIEKVFEEAYSLIETSV
jgi:hypothetical protein